MQLTREGNHAGKQIIAGLGGGVVTFRMSSWAVSTVMFLEVEVEMEVEEEVG